MTSTVQHSELRRLSAVKSYNILDTQPETDFDDFVKLATSIFGVPMSTVTIIDAHRQWFKAAVGISINETERHISFCAQVINQSDPLIVQDTSQDVRFSQNPLVLNEPHLGFYAGVPLLTPDNLVIGTFCIMDHKPKILSYDELQTLKLLASQVMKLIELRLERNKLRFVITEIDRINKALLQNEQQWKFSLESSGDGVWEWNVDTGDTIFTKKWKEMLGYSEDDLANNYEAWVSIIHPEDLKNVLSNLNEYLDKKIHNYTASYRLLCKDNTWKRILTRGIVVVWNDDGSANRMVGTHSVIVIKDDLEWANPKNETLTGLIEQIDELHLQY